MTTKGGFILAGGVLALALLAFRVTMFSQDIRTETPNLARVNGSHQSTRVSDVSVIENHPAAEYRRNENGRASEPLRVTARLQCLPGTADKQLRAYVAVEKEILLSTPKTEAACSPVDIAAWLPASLTAESSNTILVGPVEVPAAHRYGILAFRNEQAFYWNELSRGDGLLDAGKLSPTSCTGIALRLRNPLPGLAHYVARIERVPFADPCPATALLPVVEKMAPQIADAYTSGETILLQSGAETLLAPLLPDAAVRLQLMQPSGRAAVPAEIPLEQGTIRAVELDVSGLFGTTESKTVDLRGRLLFSPSELPVQNAVIERVEAAAPLRQETGPDGSFLFQGLPVGRICRFMATISQTTETLPTAAMNHHFETTPVTKEEGVPAEVIWHVPAWRWIIAELSQPLLQRVSERSLTAYPVYQLQKREDHPALLWRDAAPEAIHTSGSQVYFPARDTGVYRAAAALSPWEVYLSEEVTIHERTQSKMVSVVPPADKQTCTLELTAGDSGTLPGGTAVVISSSYPSLPPVELRTNREGRISLGIVSGDRLQLLVYRDPSRPQAVRVDLTTSCAALLKLRI